MFVYPSAGLMLLHISIAEAPWAWAEVKAISKEIVDGEVRVKAMRVRIITRVRAIIRVNAIPSPKQQLYTTHLLFPLSNNVNEGFISSEDLCTLLLMLHDQTAQICAVNNRIIQIKTTFLFCWTHPTGSAQLFSSSACHTHLVHYTRHTYLTHHHSYNKI